MNLSSNFRKKIINDCLKRKDEEACGLIIKSPFGNIDIVSCPNSSTTPKKSFSIDEKIIDEYVKKNNQIIGYYHSHIHQNANEFSWIDKAMSEQTNLISVLYDMHSGDFHIYKPCGWVAPLLNRPYMTGFFDSFTLIKDFYKKDIDIKNNFHYNRYIKSINTLTNKNKDILHKTLCKNKFLLVPFAKEKCAVIINKNDLDIEFGIYQNKKIITQFENHFSREYDIKDIHELQYIVRFYWNERIN